MANVAMLSNFPCTGRLDTFEDLLPYDALEVAKVAEESEREHIERMAELLERR